MRRRISLLLAAVLAGGTLALLSPAPPASAWLVCGGTGNATVSPGLLYPVLLGAGTIPGAGKDHPIDILIGNTNTLHSFNFGFNVGGCIHPPTPGLSSGFAAGVLLGYCGNSVGIGTIQGQLFAWIESGGIAIATGHFVATAYIIPTPGTGSCGHAATNPPTTTFALPGGATQFTLLGVAGVGVNCTPDLQMLIPGTPSDTEILIRLVDQDILVAQLGLSIFGIHVHVGVHFWWNHLCVGPPVL
jgi:hypothetical protein